jgi:hypothetical protein
MMLLLATSSYINEKTKNLIKFLEQYSKQIDGKKKVDPPLLQQSCVAHPL